MHGNALGRVAQLNFHPTNHIVKFGVMGIVPPDSKVINIPRAAGLFADNDPAAFCRREFVLHRHHNGFVWGFHTRLVPAMHVKPVKARRDCGGGQQTHDDDSFQCLEFPALLMPMGMREKNFFQPNHNGEV
jgi:hypothetical protein